MWLWQNFENWMQLAKFLWNCRVKNLDDFERDEAGMFSGVKQKEISICYIMNNRLVMFLRVPKVNVVQYWRKIVAKLKVNKWSLSKCYRYWQWIHWMSNSKEIAPIYWHFTGQLRRIHETFKNYFRSTKSTSWLLERFRVWLLR